jgi:hypothetical protein
MYVNPPSLLGAVLPTPRISRGACRARPACVAAALVSYLLRLPHSEELLHLKVGPKCPAATSAPGLGSPLPHLPRDWTHPSNICTGTGLAAATSAPGLGSPLPHRHRDWAHPCHICSRNRPTPSHICSGTGPTPSHTCSGTGPTPSHTLESAHSALVRESRQATPFGAAQCCRGVG